MTLIALPCLAIERLPAAAVLHMNDFDRTISLGGYAWLYRAPGGQWTLIDTGMDDVAPSNARRPPDRRWLSQPLLALMARHGVDPGAVGDVVITHLHRDHCGNLALFPNARWHVPALEWGFVSDPRNVDLAPEPLYPYRLFAAMREHGLCLLREGDEPVRGLRVWQTSGHTIGSISLALLSETGGLRAVLAGDVAPLYDNLARGIAPGTLWHWGDCVRALRRLGGLDVPVLPSHDPAVMERYPEGVVLA